MKDKQHQLSKSVVIEAMPIACSNELAAVEMFEYMRWGDTPCCIHCGSVNVYKMTDAKTGQRNRRFLWRCRDCQKQYTVRIGTVYEESRLDLRHWCYAFWRASTSKKGVAALEIQRHCQISYKSALFLMNRIRFAMAPDPDAPKLNGIVELDEVYVGPRKPRYKGTSKRGRGTSKIPVFCAVERGGKLRRRVVANVTMETIESAIREEVDRRAHLMTDEFSAYRNIGKEYASHQTVCHATKEYARGEVNVNTAESSHALIRRGLVGIYHNVSGEYLHRYLWQWDFLWNNRKMNDGERATLAIQSAEGKRLMYKSPVSSA
ncbi:MAG TPA: IS1595 family transposase [Candidatus Angelobacter sp.]|nr:IS1595 family transposase [Candidatus Angelobacter sp.]